MCISIHTFIICLFRVFLGNPVRRHGDGREREKGRVVAMELAFVMGYHKVFKAGL